MIWKQTKDKSEYYEKRKQALPAKSWPSDLIPSSRKNGQTEWSSTLSEK